MLQKYNIRSTLRSILIWRLAAIVLGLCFVVAVPFFVEPAVFGQYNLVLSVAQVSASALLIWPNTGFLRFGREELHQSDSIGRSLAGRLMLHGVLAALFVCLIAGTTPVLAGVLNLDPGVLLAGVLLLALTQSSAEIGILALQIRADFTSFNLAPVLQRLGQFAGILAVGATAVFHTAFDPLLLLLGGAVLGFLASGISAWRQVEIKPVWAEGVEKAKRIAGHSWTLPVISTSAFIVMWIDVWMINAFLGTDQAGHYSFAYLVTTVAIALFAPIKAGLLPKTIDDTLGNSHSEQRLYMGRVTSLITLVGAFLPIAVACAALILVILPLGSYSGAKMPLLILCSGVIFQFGLSLGEARILPRSDLTRKYTLIVLLMAVINGGLNLLLIPLLGISGAACATCATYFFGLTAQWVLLGRYQHLPRLILFGAGGAIIALMVLSGNTFWATVSAFTASCCLVALGRSAHYFGSALQLLPENRNTAWLERALYRADHADHRQK